MAHRGNPLHINPFSYAEVSISAGNSRGMGKSKSKSEGAIHPVKLSSSCSTVE